MGLVVGSWAPDAGTYTALEHVLFFGLTNIPDLALCVHHEVEEGALQACTLPGQPPFTSHWGRPEHWVVVMCVLSLDALERAWENLVEGPGQMRTDWLNGYCMHECGHRHQACDAGPS